MDYPPPRADRRVSIDIPTDAHAHASDTRATNTRDSTRSRTGRMVAADVREMVASMYKGEVRSMIRWRDVWKKFGDACEAVSKGLTGIGAVLAFASSANRTPKTSDILSFSAGTVGTLGLVLLAYSSYAIRESRQRTVEINHVLDTIGVTPLPDIAELDTAPER